MQGDSPWDDVPDKAQPKPDDAMSTAPQPVSISDGFAPMNQGTMLTGTTEMPTGQLIYLQPPSGAAKVLGILMLVYGVFITGVSALSLFSVNLLPIDELALQLGYDETNGLLIYLNISIIFSIISSVLYILAGVWVMNYRRKGVILALLITGIQLLYGVVIPLLVPQFNLGGIVAPGTGGAIVENVFGSLFCGLIWAIPLMVSNNGLDDSKLFG